MSTPIFSVADWRAMAAVYAAGEGGLPHHDDAGGYGAVSDAIPGCPTPGEPMWVRLQGLEGGRILETLMATAHGEWSWHERIRLTSFGRELYEREYPRCHELYPGIDAPEPIS